jgi:hypothetical protein
MQIKKNKHVDQTVLNAIMNRCVFKRCLNCSSVSDKSLMLTDRELGTIHLTSIPLYCYYLVFYRQLGKNPKI